MVTVSVAHRHPAVRVERRKSARLNSDRKLQDTAVLVFACIQLIAVTILQKFAIVIDISLFGVEVKLGSVEVALPIFYISFFAVLFFARPRISVMRLILFTIFSFFVFVSLALQVSSFSVNSVLLVFALYLPFVFYFSISDAVYKRMVGFFLNVMVVVGAIVLLQHLAQLIFGAQVWPNLDRIIPDEFQFHNFNYLQPIKFGSSLMKPNAEFFLEVSILSQWTAVALALELVYFKRLWRMAFYTGILLACFAGTGLLLICMCAPVLLGRVKIRTMIALVVVCAIGVTIAIKIHWYEQVNQRFDEYQKAGQSANLRFIAPIDVMIDELSKPSFFFVGEGPGAIPKERGAVWWVVAKIAYEYGVAPMIAFSMFFIWIFFDSPPSRRMAFTYLMLMNFMGGFIIPIWPLLIYTLGGAMRIENVDHSTGRRGKTSSPKSGHRLRKKALGMILGLGGQNRKAASAR